MAKVAVTDPLAEEGLDLLRAAGHEPVDLADADPERRRKGLAEAEAWIIRSGTRIDAAALDTAPRLRAVGRAGVGVDNVDLAAATARGVAVFNSPTGNITSAAEQAWALLLATARQVPAADAAMKRSQWARKELQGVELLGKTMLIVGLGRIGRMMAERAQAFRMATLGHDPFVTPESAASFGVEHVGLEEGFERAHIITLHTPLTPQTRGRIDGGLLARTRPGFILLNAARGGLVDEAALLARLEEDPLARAGIDVWAQEPPEDWSLAQHPRVVAAPHLGASTAEAQTRAAMEACQRVCDFLATGDAGAAVNAEVSVPAAMRPWVDLAERLAAFAAQTVTGPVEALTVAAGRGLELEALRVHALVGALRAGSDLPVNAINAPGLAEQKGWAVAGKALPDQQPQFVRVELRGKETTVSVEGTATPHFGARVMRYDGFDLEFRPAGRFLVTRHDDVPGVLAAVTKVLADHRLNVASMALARREAKACAVIEVDGSIPPSAREALRRLEHMHEAHRVRV